MATSTDGRALATETVVARLLHSKAAAGLLAASADPTRFS